MKRSPCACVLDPDTFDAAMDCLHDGWTDISDMSHMPRIASFDYMNACMLNYCWISREEALTHMCSVEPLQGPLTVLRWLVGPFLDVTYFTTDNCHHSL